MIVDTLRDLPIPLGLTTRALADKNLTDIRRGTIHRFGIDKAQFEAVVTALHDPQLDQLIADNMLSVGLVKARAFEGRGLPNDDDLAAKVIISQIGSERLMFQLPWKFTRGDAADFYAPLFEPYRDRDTQYTRYGTKVWQSILNHVDSGPVTILLIDGDNATFWWRKKIGNTYPEKAMENELESIRGKFGIQDNLPNNLVHGSDSIESAIRELTSIRSSLSYVQRYLLG